MRSHPLISRVFTSLLDYLKEHTFGSETQNRQMIDYEVFGYLSSRGQPKDDEEVVVDATLSDLDSSIVDDYLHRGKDNDYSEAKGSSCKAAGARGGGREGSPRCSRILRVVSGGRIVAKMQSRPPHKWQAKTSAANTRFMSSDQR